MDEPLHPSTLSEILDRTAQIYRSRFLVFVGIAIIPTATLLLGAGGAVLFFQWLASEGGPNGVLAGVLAIAFAAGLALIALPALAAVSALAKAAMNQAASRAFLGESVTIRGSYEAVWHCGWRSIGLSLVEFIAIWVLPFAAWFVLLLFSAGLAAVAQSAGVGGGGLFALAAVLVVIGLVAYAFWIAIRISLAFPAFIVERSGVWDALRRSSLLTTGTRGRILVLYLLGAALNWILSIAITLPLTIVMAMLPGASSPQHAQATAVASLCVVYGAAFAVQALTRPVYGIALMLFYYDQRIRQEGYDIERMMLAAGLTLPAELPAPEPS